MSRDLPPELSSAIAQPVVRPFLALNIELPDPVRVFTGTGVIVFNGLEFVGAGELGAVDTIGEASDGSAVGIRAMLYQVPADFRDDIAEQALRGAPFEVYVGAFDETFQTVEAFKLIWRGRTDTFKITDGGDTISVEITGESRLRDQGRPSIKRFTDEWHQRNHPGDLFFQYVSQMAEVQILWAQAEQSPSGGGVGGGFGGRFSRMVNA